MENTRKTSKTNRKETTMRTYLTVYAALGLCIVISLITIADLSFPLCAVTTSLKDNQPDHAPAYISKTAETNRETNQESDRNDLGVVLGGFSSVTGKVFSGEKIRDWPLERVFRNEGKVKGKGKGKGDKLEQLRSPVRIHDHIECEKWNVVTTIYDNSEGVRRAMKAPGWCTVIVADTKTSVDYMEKMQVLEDEITKRLLKEANKKEEEEEEEEKNKKKKKENKKKSIRGRRLVAPESEGKVVFLSVEDQLEWIENERNSVDGEGTSAVGEFLESIPFKHFARKNLGFLYAIAHGAKIIFDFDDDNFLPSVVSPDGKETILPPLHDTKKLRNAAMVVNGPKCLNHHFLMKATVDGVTWPRGFPFSQLNNKATRGRILVDGADAREIDLEREIGVLQFVADNNPDVDAVHRLVQGQVHPDTKEPIVFKRHSKYENNPSKKEVEHYYNTVSELSTHGSLLIPSHTFVPYNAQATLHMYKAFFATYLPFTVGGRISDIWRSYFAQRTFRDIDTTPPGDDPSTANGNAGLKLAFLPPDIFQDRNDHSLLADWNAEEDLYYKAEKLIDFLDSWDYDDHGDGDVDYEWGIPARMEKLWIDLYEHDYIGKGDVIVLQRWLAALAQVGYKFPRAQPKTTRHIKDVELVGSFENNEIDGSSEEEFTSKILFWYQKWRQRFQHVSIQGPFSKKMIEALTEEHELDAREMPGSNKPPNKYKKGSRNSEIKGTLYIGEETLVNVNTLFDGPDDDRSTEKSFAGKSAYPFFDVHPSSVLEGKTSASGQEFVYTASDGSSVGVCAELDKNSGLLKKVERCVDSEGGVHNKKKKDSSGKLSNTGYRMWDQIFDWTTAGTAPKNFAM
eukprot:CAMPEP_0172376926 /NCGR_PEP_ID=MMETSP1060-20121228/68639_1 /TAXON_ID=37318 /ORGANISM="Pseudo-nitzschia pungens, Strain cf. cingulata" /LENGTH=850 /DNA_ID=CAMNT_0013104591 /DNA_START=541 /DNA_END=3093 /DNA_ORIENTATION=-